jgi:hypothetical protein
MHGFHVDSNTELFLQFSTDGVPVFNSGKECMWPILCRVAKPFISPVFIVAVYGGRQKPNDFSEFLRPFVEEMISVQQHGIAVSGVTCKVAIHSFICDAPAHAEVRRIRHVNYH